MVGGGGGGGCGVGGGSGCVGPPVDTVLGVMDSRRTGSSSKLTGRKGGSCVSQSHTSSEHVPLDSGTTLVQELAPHRTWQGGYHRECRARRI